MEQRSRLTRFRQALYDRVLTRRRDAQQELLDALLLSPPVHSFPELSLSPAFKRQWHSLYKALEAGEQDEKACRELIAGQLPRRPVMVFPLDESAWPRPDAATLEDRGCVHSATPAIDGAGIVIGPSYSVLAYCAEPASSWTLPVSIRRVPTKSDAISVGGCRTSAGPVPSGPASKLSSPTVAMETIVSWGRSDRGEDVRAAGASAQ